MSQFTKEWLAKYNASRSLLQKSLKIMSQEVVIPMSKPIKKSQGSHLEAKFEALWKELNGPDLEREYRFHSKRKWRFDFCVLNNKVAIECEGGIWVNGAHSRGKHFISDATKYNQAALEGWKVFRLSGEMINQDNVLPIIELCRKEDKFIEEIGI